MKLAFHWRWMFFRESWPLATYCHAIFTLYWLFVYFIVLKLELQFSRRCFASTGNSFTHSFFFYYYYFMSDFSDYISLTDYFSLPPTPTPQLPLHCNPVISGVATIKTNARKTQCSIFSFFRPFYKSTFLSMTWPEKGKKSVFFVWCLTDNAVDH